MKKHLHRKTLKNVQRCQMVVAQLCFPSSYLRWQNKQGHGPKFEYEEFKCKEY